MNYIQIDNRETELFSILQKKKETHSNLTIETGPIDIGDIVFVINGIEYAIIERKTLRDLAASIKDGRYEEQSYRLNGNPLHNHHISYLIEGDLTKWNDKTIPKIIFCVDIDSIYKRFFRYSNTSFRRNCSIHMLFFYQIM